MYSVVLKRTEAHKDAILRQLTLRSSDLLAKTEWVNDPKLITRHVLLAGPAHGRSLEFNCGSGSVSRELRAAGWQTNTADLNNKRLIPSGEFDLVILRQLHHRGDEIRRLLSEISRVLRPGGKFIFSHRVSQSALDGEDCHLTEKLSVDMLKHGLKIVAEDFVVLGTDDRKVESSDGDCNFVLLLAVPARV